MMLPLERARLSLEGLSVGDGFGDLLPARLETSQEHIAKRKLPPVPWRWTDDTNMALSIYAVLREYGEINQNALALSFAQHYDVTRGYGPGVHRKLRRINQGEYWHDVIMDEFASYGNGGAMRVAVGTAYAWRLRDQSPPECADFLDMVLKHVPDSEVHEKIRHARDFSPNVTVRFAAEVLGNGRMITAQDTVAFTLWCAAGHLADYEDAMWTTISESGDPDTNCAIVGGIVAMYKGFVPTDWIDKREPLPDWTIGEK